jgi:VanZ family protein
VTSILRRRLSLWAPVVAYMLAIFSVSAQSDAPLPSGVSDKQGHISAYTGLSVLTMRACGGGLPAAMTAQTVTLALAMTIGYGAVDEFHQLFVPGRMGDLGDFYADAIGALLGLLGCWAWGIIAARVND